jgi:soluble cytochrome b562
MSISPLSSLLVSDLSQQPPRPFQQIQQGFQQLGSALQSGDLASAQAAYSSLQQLVPPNVASGNSSSSPGTNTIRGQFAAIGQALQSGNLSQAQGALTQLATDVRNNRPSSIQSGSTAASQPAATAQDEYVPSTVDQVPDPAQQVQQDYAQLNNALQSGNLADAKNAFSSLTQAIQQQSGENGQESITAAASSTTTDPIASDINALGTALSSGNLTQAQGAFSQLQSDVQTAEQATGSQSSTGAVGHHHHHHHEEAEPVTTTDSSSTTSTASSTGSTVNTYA